MFFAFLLAVSVADWAPMRWISAEPATLELLKGTAVNCLLVERSQWNAELAAAARMRGLALLGVVRPGHHAIEHARQAAAFKLDGVVLEGDFDAAASTRIKELASASRTPVIELPPRSKLRLDDPGPVLGTYQGVWPGIEVAEEGSAKAAPSGAPWIHTNSGFLRFLRAATQAPVWIANRPPEKQTVTAERYKQAISDAATLGARWVIGLDADFSRRLAGGDPAAVKEWRSIAEVAGYFASHREWLGLEPAGRLALVLDSSSGALFSGSILDMIAVKHTPVRAVPVRRLDESRMKDSTMAVNVFPGGLNETQRETLRAFARAGGTLLNGPPNWQFPEVQPDRITLGEADVTKLDDIWKELNSMTGRRNLGVRLFNVSSMLSSFARTPDGKQTVLHFVNYSDYPVEAITVHLLGKYKTARLLAPGGTSKTLALYEVEDGTGADIDVVKTVATLILE